MAAVASPSTSPRSASPRAAGMKKPVSRKFSANGNRPVSARWLITPPATTLSTET